MATEFMGFPMGTGIIFIIWALMVVAMLIGWVVMLVAFWRGMKAHESICVTLPRILMEVKHSNKMNNFRK